MSDLIPTQEELYLEYSETKQQRYDLGYAILNLMNNNDDLPLPNVNLLSKTMQEYYKMYGGEEAMLDIEGKWRPSIKYWSQNINSVSRYVSWKYRKYFGFLRTEGLKGIWKFMDKKEYEKYLKFTNQDLSTRAGHQNEKIELAEKKWKLDVPKVPEIPRLTNN